MKKIIVGSMMVLLLVTSFVFVQDLYKKVNKFGTAPLCPGGIHGEQELINLLNREQEAISVIFGHNDVLIKVFIQQMSGDMDIQSQWFERGSRFLSMTYRWDGKIMDTGKWEWMGKPFEAYVIVIEQVIGDFIKQHWVVIPKQCGNISLWKIETIEIEEEIPEPKIQEYPSRSINKQLPQPEPKLEPLPETKPVFPKQVIKQSPKIGYFIDMGAGEFISCRELYGLIGVGAKRRIFESTDMVMLIGVGVPIGEDRADWYTVPIIGVGFQSRVFDPFYFGIEAGVSGKMREGLKSQLEFGIEFGFKIKDTVGAYLRARAPFDEKIGWNYKIITGIRIFF